MYLQYFVSVCYNKVYLKNKLFEGVCVARNVEKIRLKGGYRYTTGKDDVVRRQWPALIEQKRMSKIRYDRLERLLKSFKAGKSVQEICAETGWRKNLVYHEMYYLKNHGLLGPEFKNPFSVFDRDIKELGKNA